MWQMAPICPAQDAFLDVTLPVLSATLRALDAEHRQARPRSGRACANLWFGLHGPQVALRFFAQLSH